jgi:hypothetical protein
MGSPRSLPAVLVAVVLILPVAACGEQVIDAEKVESFIRSTPGLQVPVAAADCPSDVAVKQGDTFKCKVRYDNGSEEAWTLEQLDDEGAVRTSQVLQTKLPDDRSEIRILPENVEALIARSASKPLEDVDCPADVKVEKGKTFTCTASFRDGTREKVSVLQRDDLGNIEVTGSRPVG